MRGGLPDWRRAVSAGDGAGERLIVRPARATGRTISCNFIDMMRAGISTSVVFFFERALDVGQLADGLALALSHVPVFAGRLRSAGDALEIACDGEGVPMAVTDAAHPMDEAIGRVTLPGAGLADHVDAVLAREGEHPLLTVRVSRLADGGMAVGCSWQHAVGDMRSFMLLMRAWSAFVDGTEPPQAHIVDDRDGYLDEILPAEHSDRPGIRLLGPGEAATLARDVGIAAMSSRTVQIYFSAAEAGRMRHEFSDAAGRQLSVNDVLCASVVTAVRWLDDDTDARSLAIAVDIRHRLGLPPGVVGNLVSEVYLTSPPDTGATALAASVRAAVGDFTSSHLSIRASRAFLESVGRSRIGDCVPIGFDLRRRTFTFSSWRRFGVYDISFGGQRPAYFSPAAGIQLPWTSWLVEGFADSGFLFTVVVPARLAVKLRSEYGRAALHRFRAPGDRLPALAAAARKLL
jgi:Transferase family